MAEEQTAAPDGTAVRVALWRAMHVQVDPPPHVLDDETGLRLAALDDGWRRRPDMDPAATARYRAGIVGPCSFRRGPGRPILRRPDRWPSDVERGGTADSDYLTLIAHAARSVNDRRPAGTGSRRWLRGSSGRG